MAKVAISKAQLRRLQTVWGLLWERTAQGGETRDEERATRLAWIGVKIGRQIGSCNELARAEAMAIIQAIQNCLPADLVKSKRGPDREQSRVIGTAGLKRFPKAGAMQLVDADTLARIDTLMVDLGWSRDSLDIFLRSGKSPVRSGRIATLAEGRKVVYALRAILRRRENSAEKNVLTSDAR